MRIDVAMAVAHLGEPRRHRRQREVSGLAGVHFVPRERRRHSRIGLGAHRVGGGHRAVLRVLVVVEEDAATLLPGANGHRGSMRALTWMPRDPDVFGQPVSPRSASVVRTTPATSRTWL